jgi:hypothetical protein
MKARSFWVVVPALAIALGACSKKEESAKPAATVSQPSEPSGAPTPAAPEAPAPGTPAVPVAATPASPAVAPAATVVADKPLTAAERAAKLGFARYLPADTESVISVHNGAKIGERAKSMKLWGVIEGYLGNRMAMPMPADGMGRDMDVAPMDEDFAIPDDAGDEKKPADKPAKEPVEEPAKEDADDKLVGAFSGAAAVNLITADGPDPGSDEAKRAVAGAKGDGADAEPPAGAVAGALIGAAVGAEEEKADAKEGDDEAMPEEPMEPSSPGDMLGLEVTFAVGKGAGEQLGNVGTLANRMTYFQTRAIAKAFAAAVKSGDFSDMQTAMASQMEEELAKNMVNDPEAGIGLLERASMPPIYVAFRTTKEKQEAVANQIAEMVGNMNEAGEMVEAITLEKAGASLTGYKLLGAKVAEEMGSNSREEMEEMLGAESVEKLLAAVAKKNLVVTSGTLGEYVVLFVGTSVEDFKLVADPAQSLTGGPALAFADAYAGKDIAGLIYGNDSAAKALFEMQGGLATYTNGLRDGLAGAEGLEDTRDLEALLQIVAEREAAIRKLGSTEALGVVAFFEEGLKVESFGGYDPGALDWKTPSKLAHLGDSPDVAVFATATADAAYDEKSRAFLEAMVETAYAVTMKVSEMPIEDEQMKEFKGMVTMFNEKFRTDALALWDAIKGDLSNGLGKESALVVDLKGSMPTIPGVPQEVVDKAKFPRATMIMPVTDRAKLKSSWVKINESATKLMAKISEVSGEDIPMQKPISSEKDGYTTWFMSLPFQSNDFIPSVTVGDKWFAASTSKDRALELLGQADKGTPGRTGMWLKVDFKTFEVCAADTMKMLEENAAAVFGEGSSQLEQFNSTKELREKLVGAMGDLDSLTVHSRREDGKLRGSVHFKTR